MDRQKPDSHGSRFAEGAGSKRSSAYRCLSAQANASRRPSGFGTAGQPAKAKPMPEPEPKKAAKAKIEKPKKEKRVRKEREPGKNRPVLRILLVIIAVAVLGSVLMVLIFGGEDTTYHQMPTIERESITHFEPEETPVTGVEGL